MAKGVALQNKLKRVLKSSFEGAEVTIDILPESDRIGATVVWRGFSGKDHLRRFQITRKAIEAGLGPQQVNSIGLIIAFTPREMDRIRKHCVKMALEV